jgi:GTP cyclohydrolase I
VNDRVRGSILFPWSGGRLAKKSNENAAKKAKKSASSGKLFHFSADEILAAVIPTPHSANGLTPSEKVDQVEDKFRDIMEILGLDLEDDSLSDTPRRLAKMYVLELFSGLEKENFPKITVIENKMKYDQMIVVQNIEVLSVCEHHFQTIEGRATVAYIPDQKVIGLSKINRIVQFFSRRPQVQERLTKQIGDALEFILGTENVAVHINAKHYCVIARGIQDSNSSTVTADLRGHFKSRTETREEFLVHCRHSLLNG